MNYKQKAKKMYDANFRIYGLGHFDISINEFAIILKAIDENEDLEKIYQHLYEKRMG